MGAATTAAPYGFWATNPTKKLAHWVYLLGQPLSRNRVFQNFSGEPPSLNLLLAHQEIVLILDPNFPFLHCKRFFSKLFKAAALSIILFVLNKKLSCIG